METFSALLAICAGNSPVPGEFPAQRPVPRSFHDFFDLRLNKPLSKQSWGWWLRRYRAHYDVIAMSNYHISFHWECVTLCRLPNKFMKSLKQNLTNSVMLKSFTSIRILHTSEVLLSTVVISKSVVTSMPIVVTAKEWHILEWYTIGL